MESLRPELAASSAVSNTETSNIEPSTTKQASRETTKPEKTPLKIAMKTEKQKNDQNKLQNDLTNKKQPIIISEDQSIVDAHLVDASHAAKAHALGKMSNVGVREASDSPPISSNITTSLITSSIKSEQSMPVRSPSKLPPYKKPSSISTSATSNASGNPQISTTQATASTCNILPQNSKPHTTVAKPATEVKVKTPLRIKRKVETTNTVNPSVPTVVSLNFRDQSDAKLKHGMSGKSASNETNQTYSLNNPSAKDIQQSISTIVTSTSSNNSDDKLNIGRHRVAPETASKIILEPDDTGDKVTVTEANGCPPLASSKEIQTSLLNISHKSPALSPSKKTDMASSKTGRGKFERGHQLSKSPTNNKNDADLETRKEVGKLIFKMGEELRDLSKKAIAAQEAGDNQEDLNILQPHCSNPLCRHNSPSTNTVVSVTASSDHLICMCGRTMALISRATKDSNTKPDDKTLITDAS